MWKRLKHIKYTKHLKSGRKKCRILFIVIEIQIKTIVRYHYKFGKNGEHNKRLATPNVVQATEQTELSCIALSSEECNYSGK